MWLLLQSDNECVGWKATTRAKRMFGMDKLMGGHRVGRKLRRFFQVTDEGFEAVELAGGWSILFKVSDQADANTVQVE